MTYDPFTRGPFPVGVDTDEWTDTDRDRTLPVEIWYPAHHSHNGQDVAPATWDEFVPVWVADEGNADDVVHQHAVRGATWSEQEPTERPLVLLIHGWAGFRRESTFIATHLASHGYVVVSPDVQGSTYSDVDTFLTHQEPLGDPVALRDHVRGIAHLRRGDIPFLVSAAVAKLPVRPTGVGVTGASFGGWSSAVAPTFDDRVAAIVPMCPANNDSPTIDPDEAVFGDDRDLAWHNPVPALVLAADRDSLLPLYGQLALFRALPTDNKQIVVLANSDHNHFVDDIDTGQAWLKEYAERVAAIFVNGPGRWPAVAEAVRPIEQLVPGHSAQLAWRGLIAAHFDAHLRSNPAAAQLLRSPEQSLASLGIAANAVREATFT